MPNPDADPDPDGYFDPEGPGEHDHHLLDTDPTENDYIACPHCGQEVLAFAQWCPHCGKAFESEAWREPSSKMSSWIGGVAVALLILLLAVWLLGGMG